MLNLVAVAITAIRMHPIHQTLVNHLLVAVKADTIIGAITATTRTKAMQNTTRTRVLPVSNVSSLAI